jgi:HK97 family phage portal protein
VTNIFERVIERAKRPAAKSLLDLYPEQAMREPLLRINSDEESVAMITSGSFLAAANTYAGHMWTHKAIKILADNIAPLPLRVARGPHDATEYPANHPVNALLDSPNSAMAPEDLWKQFVTDLMLGGEEGLEVSRNATKTKALELWPRQPDQFTVKVESYRYKRVALYRINDGAGEPYIVPADEFIHFKFYNPMQPFRGLAPISAIRLSIIIDQLAQAWTRLFFRNQARPDFAIVAPEGTTKTEKDEMMRQLEVDFSSGTGVHKPIILEDGVTDIKTFSWAPKDLEWVTQREMSRDEVAAVFGVPDEMMGYGRDTYENFSTAEKVLWTLTIVPICRFRDGTLTRYLRQIKMLAPNERVETDTTDVPQLQEDKTAKIDQITKLFGVGVPVDTASNYVGAGLPPIPGGKVGYLPIGLIEVGKRPALVAPAAAPAPKPAPEDAPEEDMPDMEDAPEGEGMPAPGKSLRKKDILEYGSSEHAQVYKALQDRIETPVRELKRIVKREFQRQQNEINRKLRDGKSYGRGRWVKEPERIPTPQELFDLQAEIDQFIEAMEDTVFGAVEEIGAAEFIGLGIAGVFDINRPEVQAAVKHILQTVAEKTNNTTWNDLIELFEEAEKAGEGIPQIMERLSAYYGDRKSDYQTERVARTTMVAASNEGSWEAWKQSEVVRGKTWISALQPGRTRDAHAAAHGQTVGLNEMFLVDGENLMYPGDPQGSPGNIINCLCAAIAVVEGAEE